MSETQEATLAFIALLTEVGKIHALCDSILKLEYTNGRYTEFGSVYQWLHPDPSRGDFELIDRVFGIKSYNIVTAVRASLNKEQTLWVYGSINKNDTPKDKDII